MVGSIDEVVERLLSDQRFISDLASRIYDRIKDEVVIRKLEESSEAIRGLQEAVKGLQETVKEHSEAVRNLQEAVREQGEVIKGLQETVRDQGEAIRGLQEVVKEHSEAIRGLQEVVKSHSEAIRDLQVAVRIQGEAIRGLQEVVKGLQETVREHSEAIRSLQEAVKGLQETVRDHGEAIKGLQEAVKGLQEVVRDQGEAIKGLQRAVEEHTKLLTKLSTEIGSFTSRAGRGLERTIMLVYREALELHGIDPERVRHGEVVDTLGVVEKGRVFEVDFYETDDYVYVFEVKNFADEGALEQLIIRKKLIPQLFNKPVKLFLVANYVDKRVKEELEREGVVVITSMVVE